MAINVRAAAERKIGRPVHIFSECVPPQLVIRLADVISLVTESSGSGLSVLTAQVKPDRTHWQLSKDPMYHFKPP